MVIMPSVHYIEVIAGKRKNLPADTEKLEYVSNRTEIMLEPDSYLMPVMFFNINQDRRILYPDCFHSTSYYTQYFFLFKIMVTDNREFQDIRIILRGFTILVLYLYFFRPQLGTVVYVVQEILCKTLHYKKTGFHYLSLKTRFLLNR